jgi:hypothetical protein
VCAARIVQCQLEAEFVGRDAWGIREVPSTYYLTGSWNLKKTGMREQNNPYQNRNTVVM